MGETPPFGKKIQKILSLFLLTEILDLARPPRPPFGFSPGNNSFFLFFMPPLRQQVSKAMSQRGNMTMRHFETVLLLTVLKTTCQQNKETTRYCDHVAIISQEIYEINKFLRNLQKYIFRNRNGLTWPIILRQEIPP